MPDWTGKHGRSAYHTGKCRCDVCRKDANRGTNKARAKRYRYVERNGGPPPGVEHGRACYTNWGCRCPICYQAQSEYNRNYKQKETAT